MSRLLLVEDDESLGATLKENLELEGYTVEWAKTGSAGLALAKKLTVDLIVLDVMLPELSGFEVLADLRKSHATPVLVISAKGSSTDRIQGLELKADDYLPKPFHLKEFLLRVQAILRRSQKTAGKPLANERVTLGLATFDLNALTVTTSSGEDALGIKEAGLLKLLLTNANKVVSREEILDVVWGKNDYPSPRTVDNFVVKLRKWIEKDPTDPKWILSHRGVGYSLRLAANQEDS